MTVINGSDMKIVNQLLSKVKTALTDRLTDSQRVLACSGLRGLLDDLEATPFDDIVDDLDSPEPSDGLGVDKSVTETSSEVSYRRTSLSEQSTQKQRIYNSLETGGSVSSESAVTCVNIAERTGLPVKTVQTRVRQLFIEGKVECDHPDKARHPGWQPRNGTYVWALSGGPKDADSDPLALSGRAGVLGIAGEASQDTVTTSDGASRAAQSVVSGIQSHRQNGLQNDASTYCQTDLNGVSAEK